MATALDTNIIIALWDDDPASFVMAKSLLSRSKAQGRLVMAAPVFAELMAAPARTEEFLRTFLADAGIAVEWHLEESIWLQAGRAFQEHAHRRRKHRDPGPRRVLADFLIGAHALCNNHRLLTLDDRFYRKAFPKLTVVGS